MDKFGWSYPPGCSGTPWDEPYWCPVCGQLDDACVCPECPRCGEIGDPNCYKEVDLGICGALYQKETPQQRLAYARYQADDLQQQWQEAMYYVDYLTSLIDDENEIKKNKKEED